MDPSRQRLFTPPENHDNAPLIAHSSLYTRPGEKWSKMVAPTGLRSNIVCKSLESTAGNEINRRLSSIYILFIDGWNRVLWLFLSCGVAFSLRQFIGEGPTWLVDLSLCIYSVAAGYSLLYSVLFICWLQWYCTSGRFLLVFDEEMWLGKGQCDGKNVKLMNKLYRSLWRMR